MKVFNYTPGNVRGNQNYANEILTGASGHELQSDDRMSTNLSIIKLFTNFEERKSAIWQVWFPIVFNSIQD